MSTHQQPVDRFDQPFTIVIDRIPSWLTVGMGGLRGRLVGSIDGRTGHGLRMRDEGQGPGSEARKGGSMPELRGSAPGSRGTCPPAVAIAATPADQPMAVGYGLGQEMEGPNPARRVLGQDETTAGRGSRAAESRRPMADGLAAPGPAREGLVRQFLYPLRGADAWV